MTHSLTKTAFLPRGCLWKWSFLKCLSPRSLHPMPDKWDIVLCSKTGSTATSQMAKGLASCDLGFGHGLLQAKINKTPSCLAVLCNWRHRFNILDMQNESQEYFCLLDTLIRRYFYLCMYCMMLFPVSHFLNGRLICAFINSDSSQFLCNRNRKTSINSVSGCIYLPISNHQSFPL